MAIMTKEEFEKKVAKICKSVSPAELSEWVCASDKCRCDFKFALNEIKATVAKGFDKRFEIAFEIFGG